MSADQGAAGLRPALCVEHPVVVHWGLVSSESYPLLSGWLELESVDPGDTNLCGG